MTTEPADGMTGPADVDIKVSRSELEDLQQRRKQAEPALPHDEKHVRQSLVGLALSGGGIRSASFNLGLLQAFYRFGLLRHVDYLSTVSGGGYVGGFFHRLLCESRKPLSRANAVLQANLEPAGRGAQPERVQRMIYGGRYLNDPLPLSNRYLIGLIGNWLVVLSGVLWLCVTVALAWRSLDSSDWGDRLLDCTSRWYESRQLFGKFPCPAWALSWLVLIEWKRPFLPFLACFGAWLMLTGLRAFRFQRGREWLRSVCNALLVLSAACFLIGGAVLVSTPNLNVTGPELAGARSVQQYTTHSLNNYLTPLFIALVAVGLLPFVQPRRLLRSGEQPRATWRNVVFQIASYALLGGVPLLGVYWFARHDFSGLSDQRGYLLHHTDIDYRRWPKFWRRVYVQCEKPGTPGQFIWSALPTEVQTWLEDELSSWPADDSAAQRGRDGFFAQVRRTPWPVDDSTWRRKQQLVQHLNDAVLYSPEFLDACPAFRDQAFLKDLPEAARGRIHQLMARADQGALLHRPPARETDMDLSQPKGVEALRSVIVSAEPRPPRTLGPFEMPCSGPVGKPSELVELNRLLLEAYYDGDIWDHSKVRRHVMVDADQAARWLWFWGTLAVFLASAIAVNLNHTSMHGFYRDQLTKAYGVSTAAPLPLSDLKTTEWGGPYALLNAGHRRLGKFWSSPQGRGAGDPEATAGFVLSRRFCGFSDSRVRSTERYCHERPTLEEAVAISGAAFNPLQVHNPLVLVLMTLLNLRLGQWLAVVSPGRTWGDRVRHWFRARPTWFALLVDYFLPDRWHFAFLTDGGVHENLGIEPLLLRGCRVIIVADATQDEKYEFEDLLRVLRRVRVRFGIRVTYAAGEPEQPLPLQLLQPQRHRARRNQRPAVPRDVSVCTRHWLVGRIEYPNGSEGFLVYLKATLDGDEDADLLGHAARNAQFPHDPTLDQMYDEAQFESYRQLGYHIAERLCRELLRLSGCPERDGMWAKKFDLDEAIQCELRQEPRTPVRRGRRGNAARVAPARGRGTRRG